MGSDSVILFWFGIVRDFSVVVILLVWIASIAWVIRDATERGANRFAALVLAVAFPFAGAFVYALIRPATRLAERKERAIWLELSHAASHTDRCQACLTPVERDFVACPSCGVTLRQRCSSCGAANELSWAVCPYCGGREEGELWTEQEPARAAASEVVMPLEPKKRSRARKQAAAEQA